MVNVAGWGGGGGGGKVAYIFSAVAFRAYLKMQTEK
jgi:hypothetical protein